MVLASAASLPRSTLAHHILSSAASWLGKSDRDGWVVPARGAMCRGPGLVTARSWLVRCQQAGRTLLSAAS